MTASDELAVKWLQTLQARGVTVTLRNNRIDIYPYQAFSELADDELLFLRHNRDAIKTAVRAGFPPSPVSENDGGRPRAIISTGVRPTPAEKPAASPRRSEALVIGRSETAPITDRDAIKTAVRCPYGCDTRCADIKATRPDAWRALHYTDPAEIKRRNAEATAVMFKMLGRPSPFL